MNPIPPKATAPERYSPTPLQFPEFKDSKQYRDFRRVVVAGIGDEKQQAELWRLACALYLRLRHRWEENPRDRWVVEMAL